VSAVGGLGSAVQLGLVAGLAPVLLGVMRQTRARLEGRAGPGVAQPWRDLRKLFRKQTLDPDGTTVVFAAAPYVLAGSTAVIAVLGPFLSTASAADRVGDLVAVVGLLLLGTAALALAGLDTGTAFGGMGASRSVMIGALAEPTIMLAAFAFSVPARSTNLARIVAETRDHPGTSVSPGALLALIALAIVIVAETGRLPVDNPSTHLELTMVHEAMVLEYSGPRLALIEWAAAARLAILLALLATLFVPFGVAGPRAGVPGLALAVVVLIAKVGVLGVLLATAEVGLAKLRLFRVPELLAGSFVVGVLSVTTAYFLRAGG
jgi:formate hydrogenlyase subunit 4